ncbi:MULTISPECIES: SCO4225 family membrane protein [Saccharopolyspora]|uniref:Integral membrane protein n=1 Tax=Saccharopolyspora gregorii TaxID=33914 RepID=A0ABP6RQF0_9PSEU|nr:MULTISPECIES: hypothetical protein [Saccharopolyspora]MCA1184838.1 hypothetical protein [Saccharopolyspora sp. 6T]MCA1190563.1 hypothetical protein [Saccharopolyspora sp. 6V]MCA1226432.1 hypothetical protein [Saccharopolyspora sp. 6M]MCA1280861.1 hypothetical protein [Saccharopolyspora sp. 7B]
MTEQKRSPIQAFRRLLVNPVSLGYLALVAAVWAWVLVMTFLVPHPDASLAGVWGFLVTAPTSLLFLGMSSPLVWVGVAVAAVFQALLLGAAYRGITGLVRRAGTSAA